MCLVLTSNILPEAPPSRLHLPTSDCASSVCGRRRGRVCRTISPVGRTTKIGRREGLAFPSAAAKGRRPMCSALSWGVDSASLTRLGKKPISQGTFAAGGWGAFPCIQYHHNWQDGGAGHPLACCKGRRPVCRGSALSWGVDSASLTSLGKKPISQGTFAAGGWGAFPYSQDH